MMIDEEKEKFKDWQEEVRYICTIIFNNKDLIKYGIAENIERAIENIIPKIMNEAGNAISSLIESNIDTDNHNYQLTLIVKNMEK